MWPRISATSNQSMFLIVCDALPIALRIASSVLVWDVPTSSISLYVCEDMNLSDHLQEGRYSTLCARVKTRSRTSRTFSRELWRTWNIFRVARVPCDVVH